MKPTKKELEESKQKAEENRKQAEEEWQRRSNVLEKFRSRIIEATQEAANEGYMVELYVGCSNTSEAELGVRVRAKSFKEMGIQQPKS